MFVIECSDGKLSGKRKKRTELANKAALEEQLEIELEQQALKVVNQAPGIVKPPAPTTSTKKSQQLVSINLLDLVASSTVGSMSSPVHD